MFTCYSHNVKTRIIIRVLRIILVVLPEHPSDTYVFTMKMEILLEPTSNKLMVVTNRFTLIVLSALRRSDKENKQVRSVLTDPEVQVKMEMEIPRSSGVNFITACSYSTDTSKDLMKAQADVILDFFIGNDFAQAEVALLSKIDKRHSTLSIIAKVVETYQPGVIVLRCWAGSHAGDGVKINQGMYVKDDTSELSILVNRSIGGSTIVDRQLMLMLHMRFLYYDGVAEALNGTLCAGDDCRGLAVPWSNERPLENKELNAIIGAWFTLWRD
ncbi:probable alpha-mannosidase [Tanacetum coccineum]